MVTAQKPKGSGQLYLMETAQQVEAFMIIENAVFYNMLPGP